MKSENFDNCNDIVTIFIYSSSGSIRQKGLSNGEVYHVGAMSREFLNEYRSYKYNLLLVNQKRTA